MPDRIVVVGASAGGVEALTRLVAALPRDFAAPVVVVLHMSAEWPSVLPQILARAGRVPVGEARDGERLRAGHVYAAVPDHHVLVDDEKTLRVGMGPRENRHRPAIDPLFRSAALVYRSRCIGVILTGTLDDGTVGMLAVKRSGGVTIVQDPDDAMYPSMPQNVLDNVKVDFRLPLDAIAAKLVECLMQPCAVREPAAGLEVLEMENKIVALDPATMQHDDRPGAPSAYSCPDCGGVLWEIEDGEYARFRCRVGHAFSPETMLDAQGEVLEEALWSAMKTLEESARLSARLAESERRRGHDWLVKRFEERERDARQRADTIRTFLSNAVVPAPGPAASRRR